MGIALALTGLQAWALKCDVDNNGRIDRVDVTLIQQAVAARAQVSGPDDPRDPDNNLIINSVDSRICALRCKYASCATNGAPTADAGVDQTVRVGETVRLTGAASSDPDGDALSYTWVLQTRPAGSAAVLTGAATINPSFVADRPGNYTVALVVGDGQTSSGADTVTISTANSAPVANAGADQTARVGDTVTLDGRGSNDVDGDTLSYAWRIVSRPASSAAALDNPAAVQPRLTIDAAGSYELELVVNDGTVASAADRVIVSTLNSAPVARPGNNQAVALGALVQLNGSASSDVDGDSLTYAWSLTSRPAGSSATLTAPTSVNPSFVADRPGTYVAQLIVNDGQASSTPASVVITTDNAAPSANAGPDQTVPLAALVQLTGAASSDPEGQPLTYAWSLTSRPAGSTAALDNPAAASPRFTADKPGSYVAQLIVSDGTLASAPDTVVISTLNSRPVADAGAPQAVDTGSTVQLDGSGSRDADGDALTYAWSFTTRPAGSAAAINPTNAQRPSFVADLPGTYVAQLIVSDGALASVPVTVTITVTTPNRPPVAVAGATPTSVNVGSPVALSAAGSSDPDGNAISYAWAIASRPVGSIATISNATAATAGFVPDVAGAYTVQLTVSDGSLSATALAGFTANAVVTNRPPVIVTVPGTVATVAAPYAYDVDATDPDAGDTLTYSLSAGPSNMTINPVTGLINWSPTPAQVGSQPVTVRVTDAGGLFATQSYSISVTAAPTAIDLSAALNPAIANAGQTVTLSVLVSGGNGGAITTTAVLDGTTPLTLSGGSATFAAPAAGVHKVLVTATGSAVNGQTPATQTRELILTVRDASDTTAPVAAITSPATDTEVLQPVPVIGTATDARFAYYQLLLKPAGAPATAWVELRRGLSPVSAAALGTLDPTKIANGVYDLGLNVVDVNGRASTAQVTIEIARDRKIGQFRINFVDINASAAGMPLTLNRTYDSLKKDISGDFGFGWSADASDTSVRKNMVLGLSWQLQTSGFNQCLRPIGNRRVTVTLPDGGVYRFQASNNPVCAFAVPPEVSIQFDPLPLPVGGATGASAGGGSLTIANLPSLVEFRGGVLFDWDALEAWNPTDYIFTSNEGTKYTLREGVGVIAMVDRYGNRVDYGPNGYQHNASLGVQLVRDAQGRVTRATDPAGKSLTYGYNAAGELASVTDRLGQITYFQYDTATSAGSSGSVNSSHLLASITDPRGVVVMRAQFDEFGRLAGTADGNGDSSTQTFDEATNEQRVVDRRGNATTYTFDAAGNITRVIDAKGGITDLTYDANGNELTRKDPLGNTVTKTYNAVTGKVLTERDPLGRTTTTAYPTTGKDFERQNPVSVTDPLGRVTTIGYRLGEQTQPGAVPNTVTEPLGRVTSLGQDTKGNLTSLSVGGVAISYTYDTKGRRTREADSLGNAVVYTYDDNGNELTRSVTRTVAGVPRTETTTKVYDAENRQTQETDATGAVRRATYDAAGRVATSTDAIGRVTSYTYDANSRLIRTDFPDGTSEQTEFDSNGNEATFTDRAGRVTSQSYDELNRLVRVQLPDGTVRTMEYDAAGRLTAEVDGTSARRTHEYDAASQRTATVEATGRRTEHSYDAAGNRTQIRLPDGRVIGFTYDALNRLTRSDYPDGSALVTTYRPDGRKATETDARGVLSTFGYDTAGRLTSVQQSGVATASSFIYDETGSKTAQRDAAGREVQWTYDREGRPLTRRLPDGAVETFTHDLEGQLTGYTTFGGQTVVRTYDSAGRETSRTIPATSNAPARSVTWTYTADGLRATQTETGTASPQGTTTYTYDGQRRLIQLAGPQGTLSWTYDGEGRVTQRTTSEGSTVYGYDADGRLARLEAPDGKVTTYTYDLGGRPLLSEQTLDAAAGISLATERRHDAQDRLVTVAHSKRSGAGSVLVAGQAITRAAGGAVTRIDTFDASAAFVPATGAFTGSPVRVQTFGYDANARLTQENDYKGAQLSAWLTNNSNPATRATTYGYDSVGNRLSRTDVTAGGTESTAYTYDGNDRLLTETLTTTTGSTVLTTYTWDGNGNLASRTRPSDFTGYVFDADNRLVEVRAGTNAGSAVTVATYGYDADGRRISKTTAAGTSRFLIDPTAAWPQVVLESRGSERVAYVWGDTLRQQLRGTAGSLATAPTESLVPLAGHLDTPLAAVDNAASRVESIEIDAFGTPASGSPRLSHVYGGEYWDATAGLVQLRARWYQPTTGRFLSIDPVSDVAAAPKSAHRYAYAGADPLFNTDPAGTSFAAGGIADIGLSMNLQSSLSLGSQVAARQALQSFLVGKPPKDLGLIGEMILDWAIKAVTDTVLFGGSFPNKGALGTAAHQELKRSIQSYKPLPGVEVIAEPFFDDNTSGKPLKQNKAGTLGVDVLIRYKGKNVLAFDLKIGKGYSKKGISSRMKRIGTDVIQINIKVAPK